MEVKIGVQHAPREIVVEVDSSADDVEQLVSQAVDSSGVLTLTDAKGRKGIIPATPISYVEVGGGVSGQVGFRL